MAQLQSITVKCTEGTPHEVDLLKAAVSLTFHSMQHVILHPEEESGRTKNSVVLDYISKALLNSSMLVSHAATPSWQGRARNEVGVS